MERNEGSDAIILPAAFLTFGVKDEDAVMDEPIDLLL
jgi:hypothetical protein